MSVKVFQPFIATTQPPCRFRQLKSAGLLVEVKHVGRPSSYLAVWLRTSIVEGMPGVQDIPDIHYQLVLPHVVC